jgi:hypothetical protein
MKRVVVTAFLLSCTPGYDTPTALLVVPAPFLREMGALTIISNRKLTDDSKRPLTGGARIPAPDSAF